MTRRVLRLKDVKEATGLSRSSIYALRKWHWITLNWILESSIRSPSDQLYRARI